MCFFRITKGGNRSCAEYKKQPPKFYKKYLWAIVYENNLVRQTVPELFLGELYDILIIKGCIELVLQLVDICLDAFDFQVQLFLLLLFSVKLNLNTDQRDYQKQKRYEYRDLYGDGHPYLIHNFSLPLL